MVVDKLPQLVDDVGVHRRHLGDEAHLVNIQNDVRRTKVEARVWLKVRSRTERYAGRSSERVCFAKNFQISFVRARRGPRHTAICDCRCELFRQELEATIAPLPVWV